MGKGKGEPEYWAAVGQAGHGAVRIGRRHRGAGQGLFRPLGPQDADARAVRQAAPGVSVREDDETMKAAELRDMSDEQLELTLKETCESLFRLRIQAQTERLGCSQRIAATPPADRPGSRRFSEERELVRRRKKS